MSNLSQSPQIIKNNHLTYETNGANNAGRTSL